MSGLIISFLTFVLILISVFVVLLVLMQRTSQSGGMGAALGGGAAESAFGSDTNNVLTKGTIYGTIAFFIIALGLFLIYQSQDAERSKILDPVELISDKTTDPVPQTKSIVEDLTAISVEAVESAVETVEETVDSGKAKIPVNDIEQPVTPVTKPAQGTN